MRLKLVENKEYDGPTDPVVKGITAAAYEASRHATTGERSKAIKERCRWFSIAHLAYQLGQRQAVGEDKKRAVWSIKNMMDQNS